MSRVCIGGNVVLRLSRRTLCDNCSVNICFYRKEERVTECEHFVPILAAFRRCTSCGNVFEVAANCMSLQEDMCLQCSKTSYSGSDQ